MARRTFLASATALIGAAAGAFYLRNDANAASDGAFPVSFTPDQWRERLTPAQFSVLRDHATEAPFSSPLNDNKKSGLYSCAGCDTPVYSSETKFDSGTGWPSFYAPLSASVIGTSNDYALIYPRTEVHCATCGGHFGHIFDDGPKPTGKRHCLNGVALKFKPGASTVG
ncbi:peptide-methionine (R)-S-oxide reductase [Fulvimarina endophytica]|uniref:peptide-methionine (R)-S-oxide reductase n=1 Tax=Fulvimarina endophytica TaxID=2293836 RepID=A0A371X283_9HYPH|nr:peptide-methionine (R)-S-oxide reductase MsrB [Fulvimarina endophytica]RFC63154.1 peptide-methionine (R)-S-oxide reductase [Fulvimarina endophytica]